MASRSSLVEQLGISRVKTREYWVQVPQAEVRITPVWKLNDYSWLRDSLSKCASRYCAFIAVKTLLIHKVQGELFMKRLPAPYENVF